MKEPHDSDLCLACEHPWAAHGEVSEFDIDACECCKGGEFVGQPIPADDLPDEALSAYGRGEKKWMPLPPEETP